ncbi:TonB-dependent receptor domain-containing protein [Sphingomonas astaxanthinifaciens]|uniref:TonB-dependent receptor n=1 Tax=Sphingomonas astaxanthinifaciens DSM 22298 TaxID=1123267 RepID=A0ABQ5Z688_9SPHN|nr:TonB-dependent receptor [Sphingomonas astaxanthinifaciens]GLR46299.1 TonB-dependent receptor [Sphingomonas astaxanthinifaciens DSM 22298]
MTKVHLLGATALRGIAAATLIAGFSSTAFAQEVEQEKQQEAQAPGAPTTEQETESNTAATTDQDIVVTGSRIRRPNLESTVPVTSVGGEEFFETGNVSVGDALNDLPALRSTLGQSNSTQFLGTSGLNLLDLRGLGTQRTLVLVNGRRHVPGDILYNANSPDVNTIPTDLIERVDVVTGGNSAIYGSDAIAGVVNFVLKKDYSGLQIRGQGGISKYGDAGAYYTSLLAGKNFADGRGNVAINLEYARQNDYYASGRPNLRQQNGFVTVDTDPADAVNGSDGNPDAIFYRDIRSATYSNAGTFRGARVNGFRTPYIFQPDGTLALQTGTRVGRGPNGSFIGGNGDNFRDGTQFGLSPKLDRYSANLVGHFEISPALEPFVEAKFSRTDSLGNASGPFFTGAVGERFSTSNPYLADQARGIIRDYYGDYYDAAGNYVAGGDGINDADQFGFTFLKNAVDLGNREEKGRRDTYRIVTGVRGDLGSNLNYEFSINYGEHREKTKITGNVNLQRYLLAIDAVQDGSGNVVCRAKLDPTSASAFVDSNFARQQLVNDIATCVPVNLFGSGNITQQARDYLLTNSRARAKLTQLDITGFVSGDTGTFFNLPGGPVGFALGGEYRRETAFYDQDDFTQSGLTFYNGIATWRSPKFKVKEAFGELRFPILKNSPFFEELTLSAAGRVSDYKGRTGTVYAYNAGLDWAPVRDIRFRANYSRAVRAPNLSDLSFPLSQNYSLVSDPCSLDNRDTPLRQTNCAAAGVPADFNYIYLSSLPFQSGGNPNLREEKSDSYTVGAVIQPRFLPGFSASVDYYDITVNNVITALSAQSILDACYDQTDINNQFCGQFQRAGAAGGPNGEQPFQIIDNSLQVVPLNFAKLKVRGIDVEVAYRREIGNLGRLNTRFIYTRALENASFLNPIDPKRGNTANGELGSPKNAFNWKTSLEHGPFTIGYEMRYLDKMTNGAYENYFSYQGRPPENADAFSKRFYPAVFYHDVRLAIDAGKKYNFYVGVDNLLNTNPPLGASGIGDGSGIYSNRGRFFYSGFVAKF